MVSNTNVPMTPGIFPPRIFQRWAGFGLICVNRAKSRGAICSIRFAIGSSYKQRLLSFLFVKARLAIPPLTLSVYHCRTVFVNQPKVVFQRHFKGFFGICNRSSLRLHIFPFTIYLYKISKMFFPSSGILGILTLY